jgi:lysozyme family protein
MTEAFNRAVEELFKVEGGYSNNASDRGGKTKYGVTEAVARACGYLGDMADLSDYQAKEIAKARYWDVLRGDEIAALSEPIMREVFDTGYNCGVATAARFLQLSLNVLNRQEKDYGDVVVDGVLGPMTIHALRLYLTKRGIDGQSVLLKVLNCLQGNYYVTLGDARKANEDFVYGWIRNRVAL